MITFCSRPRSKVTPKSLGVMVGDLVVWQKQNRGSDRVTPYRATVTRIDKRTIQIEYEALGKVTRRSVSPNTIFKLKPASE